MELDILNAIQQLRSPFWDWLMPVITSLGNAGILWIILSAGLLIFPKTRKTGLCMAAALALEALLCNLILKPLAARIRPCDVNQAITLLISRPKDYSFPSGHTSASFSSASALFFSGHKKGAAMAGIMACLIAFSRMYLYVHYPTDVLAGMVIGLVFGWIGWKLIISLSRSRFSHTA